MTNQSKLKPVDIKVLLLPEAIEEKTQGGIILPDTSVDAEKARQSVGTLIASGKAAFTTNSAGYEWDEEDKPKIGDKVFYAAYSGTKIQGLDGNEYRLIKDIDINGIYEE